MISEQYTKVGFQIGDLIWRVVGLGILGLVMAFFRSRRWLGILLALASATVLVLRVPYPFCSLLWFVGSIFGTTLDRHLQVGNTRSAHREWIGAVLSSVLVFIILLWSFDGKNITLTNDGVLSTATTHQSLSAGRKTVAAYELFGWDGKPVEWRFLTSQGGAKNGFVANVLFNELYWDHSGHVMTGKQLAIRLANWGGVKFRRTTYGDFPE